MSTPHPLAQRLIERLQSHPHGRVLDFGSGSGRNAEALRRAGFAVIAIDDAAVAAGLQFADIDGSFAAAISTHGMLHGSANAIAARVRTIAECLEHRGLFFATFGSVHDTRFGRGRQIDESTFAPTGGDERGIPHVYFDRCQLLETIEAHFDVDSLEHHGVDSIAGAWAHRQRPLNGAAHWFAIACKR